MNIQSLLMRYGGQAVFYAVGLLMVTGWWTQWGVWYSSSVPYRLQTEALVRGKLALSENPMDLDHDFAWSQQGVHQVWILGVPLWRLPLEATAKLLGFAAFPDRIAFGLFAALVAFLALRLWRTAWPSNSQQRQRPTDLVWRSIAGFGDGFLLLLLFPPFLNLLQTRGAVWEEAVAYEYLFGVLLLTLLLAFSQRPTARRWYWLCALAGLGGLIRPPLVFYGFSTMALALWIGIGDAKPNQEAQEGSIKSRRRVGFVALAGVLLFCFGGGLLWGTNRLRFGDGFEFGHQLNMQDMVGSLYATKFDHPFEEEPWASAAAELFGALFLAGDNYNRSGWIKRIFLRGSRRWFVGGSFIVGLMIGLICRCCSWAGEWGLRCWERLFGGGLGEEGRRHLHFYSHCLLGRFVGWGFWEGGRCWRRCRCLCFTCGRRFFPRAIW